MEMYRQLRQLKLDDLANIVQKIYLALYAEGRSNRITFDPDREWTPDTIALVASILEEYGLKPSALHAMELGKRE